MHFYLIVSIHISFASLNLIRLPPLNIRLSSCCAANDADAHLPAGDPGAGEPGSAAGRPRHLHGQVHRETVQPDGLLIHHDDWWEIFALHNIWQQKAERPDGLEMSLLTGLQEEFVSHWQSWAPCWEGSWCEGWSFLWAAPASCARPPSLSACSPLCLCCWLAAPPRRLMESTLLGKSTVCLHAPSMQMKELQTSPPTMSRFHLNHRFWRFCESWRLF